MKKEKIRLRAVQYESFCYSEATLFEKWRRKNRNQPLRPGEAVCFISLTENQILFVYRPWYIKESDGDKHYLALHSRRVRLFSGTWHPWMLANYAAQVNLDINLKSFEDHYKQHHG